VHARRAGAASPAALERCKEDIAQGDIIVVTMLFIEDHIKAPSCRRCRPAAITATR
jgi:magnesium chelatase subunit H